MKKLADILVGLIALEHIWFLVLEMFLWTKPKGWRHLAPRSSSHSRPQPLLRTRACTTVFWQRV